MAYTDFYNLFKNFFTVREIQVMQDLAFSNYKDAHGFRPMRKEQKQVAYGFIEDLIYNMGLNECVDFLGSYGIVWHKATALWLSMNE